MDDTRGCKMRFEIYIYIIYVYCFFGIKLLISKIYCYYFCGAERCFFFVFFLVSSALDVSALVGRVDSSAPLGFGVVFTCQTAYSKFPFRFEP